jgi:FlaA1/EpsC-like NDP-sugar epimerase
MGSFGKAVLNPFLETDIHELRIFRHDEKAAIGLNHSLDLSIFV